MILKWHEFMSNALPSCITLFALWNIRIKTFHIFRIWSSDARHYFNKNENNFKFPFPFRFKYRSYASCQISSGKWSESEYYYVNVDKHLIMSALEIAFLWSEFRTEHIFKNGLTRISKQIWQRTSDHVGLSRNSALIEISKNMKKSDQKHVNWERVFFHIDFEHFQKHHWKLWSLITNKRNTVCTTVSQKRVIPIDLHSPKNARSFHRNFIKIPDI